MYLQKAESSSCDAQGVKDAQYILPTPDFTGAFISPFRHQALALLDPATPWTKHPQLIFSKIMRTTNQNNKVTELLTLSCYSRSSSVAHVWIVWYCCWPCCQAHPWMSTDCRSLKWSWHSPLHSPQCCGPHQVPRSGLPGRSPSSEIKKAWDQMVLC